MITIVVSYGVVLAFGMAVHDQALWALIVVLLGWAVLCIGARFFDAGRLRFAFTDDYIVDSAGGAPRRWNRAQVAAVSWTTRDPGSMSFRATMAPQLAVCLPGDTRPIRLRGGIARNHRQVEELLRHLGDAGWPVDDRISPARKWWPRDERSRRAA